MPLHAAHPGTRNSEVCPWPMRAEWAPQGNKEENKSDNICLLTFNAVLVRKRFCHFLDFGLYFFSIFDAVQCFSVSGCSFSYMFRQFLTCVWIFLLSLRRFLQCFLWRQECAHLRRGCFHLGGLVSSCAAVHAAFQHLLHASALVSQLFKVHNERKHNAQGKQKQTSLWRPMGEWLISMLRAKALQQNSLEMTVCRWPWPSITVPQLPQGETDGAQSALIKWKFTRCKAARCLYILGQAFHKAFSSPTCPRRTPSKNWKSTLDTVSSLWLWCCGCWREVSAPGPRLLLFGFLQWAPLLNDDIHPAPLLNDDLHPAVLASIFISIFAPGSLCSCCRSLMPAALYLWWLACGRVWQVAVIFCGIFSVSARMHAVFLRAFATFSLEFPRSFPNKKRKER